MGIDPSRWICDLIDLIRSGWLDVLDTSKTSSDTSYQAVFTPENLGQIQDIGRVPRNECSVSGPTDGWWEKKNRTGTFFPSVCALTMKLLRN